MINILVNTCRLCTVLCVFQMVWYLWRIAVTELACRNIERLAEAVIVYGEELLAKGEKDKVQQIVSQVAKSLAQIPENVWKLEDMIPAWLYVELYPYF